MGGQHHAPIPLDPADHILKVQPFLRVQSRRRFVQQQHIRVADQRLGNAQPPLHTAGQGLDRHIPLGRQVQDLQQVVDLLLRDLVAL